MKNKKITAKENIFLKSFKLAKSSPNKLGYTVLFDILFFVTIYILQMLSQYAANNIAIGPAMPTFYIFLLLSAVYYLTIVFAYSFFKYIVLDYIKSLFEKAEFNFKRLGQFYSLNIVIAGIFFSIMILANFLLAGIKPQYRPYAFIALAIPYLLFLYVVLNLAHSFFYQGASVKESLKKGFNTTFTKIKAYRETIAIMILSALLLWLLFFGSGYLIRLLGQKNYSLYLSYYSYFKQVSIIAFDLVLYAVVLINRISFYSIAKEFK